MLCVKGVTKSVRQKTFWALQGSVWSKNKGGGGVGGVGASLDPPMLVSSSINAKTAIFK